MPGFDDEIGRLRTELAYYKRRADELAGENLKLDMAAGAVKHELRQRRQAFALLSRLQQSIGAHTQISSIFDITLREVHGTLGMDRTVLLTPTNTEHGYRPTESLGMVEGAAERLAGVSLTFPPEFASGHGVLLVAKATPPTPLIDAIRSTFELPYFLCVPVGLDESGVRLILAGRIKEAPPIYPPLDQGDVDTFQAIAGLISASVRNMRVAVLEETDRLKTAFFANISHEFRTPITLTIGPLEQILAARYGAVPDGVREQLLVVLRNQERLLGLVNQILDVAKLEAGRMELRAARIPDLNRFIEERAVPFRLAAERRGLELRLSLDPRVRGADVFIDREKLDKLLSNLLGNALKFTRRGHVEVATALHDRALVLAVSDTGTGISAEQLPHIFDRFRQADGGAAREYAGTGLGLALVKEIATLHGGTVTVQSEPGVGSSFRVTIPLGRDHLDPSAVVEFTDEELEALRGSARVVVVAEGSADQEGADRDNETAERTRDPARPTILYAEDNPDLRKHVRDLLADNYNVFLAVDGREGLANARRYRPDLIISDQMMPQLSGRGFLRAIRDDPELRMTPVIFLTARAGTSARIESLEAGADDYLAKPFDSAELAARVRTLLRARVQERELAELNRTLERRVQEQVAQLERLGRLKRFFSPQLAELIAGGGTEDPLRSHRREITVVFVDLRGFTAFAESVEPEELMAVLREYHAEMGRLILRFEGTLERFTGDGMMVFFNDPVPVPDPARRAVRMALAMRERVAELSVEWRRRDYELDFGVGVAQGYATIGAIGFEGRWDYGAIGSVTNLAARLCGEAQPGQILVPRRVLAEVDTVVDAEPVGARTLKGFHRPVVAFNIVRSKADRTTTAGM